MVSPLQFQWCLQIPTFCTRKLINEGFIILKSEKMQVGNAVTDVYYDGIGTVTYWWSHSLISDKTYKSIMKHCNFRSYESSQECDDVVNYALGYEFGKIDQYNIYSPICKSSEITQRRRFKNMLLISPRYFGYDPCIESYSDIYYNRPDVQKALHANTTGIPYKWTPCR